MSMATSQPIPVDTTPLSKPADRAVYCAPDEDLFRFLADCRAQRIAILNAESRP